MNTTRAPIPARPQSPSVMRRVGAVKVGLKNSVRKSALLVLLWAACAPPPPAAPALAPESTPIAAAEVPVFAQAEDPDAGQPSQASPGADAALPPVAVLATVSPGAARSFFRLKLDDDGGTPRERLIAFVTLRERSFVRPLKGRAGKLARVVVTDLGLEAEGRLLREDDLERLGIPTPPVEPIPVRQTVVRRTVDERTSVWWRHAPLETEAEVDAVLKEAPDFLPLRGLGKKPKHQPMDVPMHYASSFGSEPVSCTAFAHPAYESGDTFDVERCFVPSRGTLAFTKLISVWGSYELELLDVAH